MRKSWPSYWLDIADQVATRSTCSRLSVGTVIAHDNVALISGYNGALPGCPHCMDREDMPAAGACGCNHSEANAVCLAARRGVALKGATAFVTVSPCEPCARLLVMAGVVRIAYRRQYRLVDHLHGIAANGVIVEHVVDATE